MDTDFWGLLLIGFSAAAVIAPLISKITIIRVGAAAFLLYVVYVQYGDDVNSFLNLDDSITQKEAQIISLPEGTYLVGVDKLNVRIAPNKGGQVVSSLTRGQEVFVFETVGEYARVSDYFDGSGYGESGDVAQWVGAAYLEPSLTPGS